MQGHEQDDAQQGTGAPEAAEAAPRVDAEPVTSTASTTTPAEPEPPQVIDLRDARIAELEKQLSDTQGRLRAVSKAYTDQKAEMAAFRERVEAQAKSRESMRGFETVKAFFDPVQNLQRSIEVGTSDPEALIDGIKMVHKQFVASLTRLGLEPVPGIGADFDPNVHEALAMMPVNEPSLDGKVLIVHVDGYMVGGRGDSGGSGRDRCVHASGHRGRVERRCGI